MGLEKLDNATRLSITVLREKYANLWNDSRRDFLEVLPLLFYDGSEMRAAAERAIEEIFDRPDRLHEGRDIDDF